MSEGTAPLPFFATDSSPDTNNPAFDFASFAYVQIPLAIHRDTETIEAFKQRNADDEAYQQSVAPTDWHRFTTLGFQATTGKDFDSIWRKRYDNPLRFHRVVWYNYLYYADRGFDMMEKLHFWATQVSQPFLIQHSAASLNMDTEKFTWAKVIAQFEKHDDQTKWLEVGANNRPPRGDQPSTTAQTTNQQSESARGTQSNLPGNIASAQAAERDNDNQGKTTDPDQLDNAVEDMHSVSDAKQSAVTTTNEIAINDGSHRISFKWRVSKGEFSQLTESRARLISEIHSILGVVYSNSDGKFYRWEGEALSDAKTIQQLSLDDVKHYLAPEITAVQSANLIIFSVRFGYTENPIAWKMAEDVRTALQVNNIQIGISNCTTTSGKLVIAGYILLKHPTMTHRHRYLQYLRSKAPEKAPFFDILVHKRTPTDQIISHLVVECGENDVTSLCQVLSTLLSGTQTSVFLPRYAFAKMSNEQIKGHFEMHEKYIKSLHQFSLAPRVSSLDRLRVEYKSDGQTVERSTREWAYSLTLPDGSHAQCDIDNGGKNKIAFLLIPSAFKDVIKPIAMLYKDNLQPLSKREERYRNSIPDLPDVIHITSNVQSNIDFMAKLSSTDIWSKAPTSVKPLPYAAAAPTETENAQSFGASVASDKSIQWPSLVKRPSPGGQQANPKQPPHAKGKRNNKQKRGKSSQISVTSIDDEDRASSTASTQSLTNTLRSTVTDSKLSELEAEMKECRDMLKASRDTAKDSAKRLVDAERGLQTTMRTMRDLTGNVTNLQAQFNDFTVTLESVRMTLQQMAASQVAMVPYGMQPPPLSPANQLATIPEASRRQEGDDYSRQPRSPEKKKGKRLFERGDDNDDVEMKDGEPDADGSDGDNSMQLSDYTRNNDEGNTAKEDSREYSQTQQTANATDQTTQQPPSPPDAQYETQSDPAGRENT